MAPVVSVRTGVVMDIFCCWALLPNRKPASSRKASVPLAVGSLLPPSPMEEPSPKEASATRKGSYLGHRAASDTFRLTGHSSYAMAL